jgi:hypothetical protein
MNNQKITEALSLFTELIEAAMQKAMENDDRELGYKYLFLHGLVIKAVNAAMLLGTLQIAFKSALTVDLDTFGDD